MAHIDIPIRLDGTRPPDVKNPKVGDTFAIIYPLDGFTYRYTNEVPLAGTADKSEHRKSGEKFKASKKGTFPFECFQNGKPISMEVGGPVVAGELIIDPKTNR